MPTTPYLIRGIYEWCQDEGFTPHLLVDTEITGVVVPRHLVDNGAIMLNIQASAVRGLELGNDWIVFSARFSGKSMEVMIPINSVRAIMAKENGLGCAFESHELLDDADISPVQSAFERETSFSADLPAVKQTKKGLSSVKKSSATKSKNPKKPDRSHLKLVD